MWILILYIAAGYSTRTPVVTAVNGFNYEQACKSAGSLATSLDNNMKFVCVKGS